MKLREKNQLTLPAGLARRCGFTVGGKVEFEAADGGGVIIRPAAPGQPAPRPSLRSLRGAWRFAGGYRAAMKLLRG